MIQSVGDVWSGCLRDWKQIQNLCWILSLHFASVSLHIICHATIIWFGKNLHWRDYFVFKSFKAFYCRLSILRDAGLRMKSYITWCNILNFSGGVSYFQGFWCRDIRFYILLVYMMTKYRNCGQFKAFQKWFCLELNYIYLAISALNIWRQPKNYKDHTSTSTLSNLLDCFKCCIYKQQERKNVCFVLFLIVDAVWTDELLVHDRWCTEFLLSRWKWRARFTNVQPEQQTVTILFGGSLAPLVGKCWNQASNSSRRAVM